MPLEPGHPQELCALLVMISLLAGTYLETSRLTMIVLLGVLCGFAITCKVNVGIFLAIALGTAVATSLDAPRLRKAALITPLQRCGVWWSFSTNRA